MQMINYHACYLSTLYSFNQGSLFHRNGQAGPSFLVKPMAQAIVYLNAEIDGLTCGPNGSDNPKIGSILRNLMTIDRQARQFGLSIQLAREVDTLRKTGFLQSRD